MAFCSGCTKNNSSEESIQMQQAEIRSEESVDLNIVRASYMIYFPDDIEDIYDNGQAFESGIDAWNRLDYESALSDFESLNREISDDGAVYEEDRIFIKTALGCLYNDLARYDDAYDCLLDAYVSCNEIYDNNSKVQAAVSLALCKYYIASGDYERCGRELLDLADAWSLDYEVTADDSNEEVFLELLKTNIEADMYYHTGDYINAYSLYFYGSRWISLDAESIASVDKTDLYLVEADIYKNIGDVLYAFGIPYSQNFIAFSEEALYKLDKYYAGNGEDEMRGRILLKRGYNLSSYEGYTEESLKNIEDAVEILESVYETEESFPGLVEAYSIYGDVFGFIKEDQDKAILYYEKALALAESVYGYNHPETAKVYERMGNFYGNKAGDNEAAEKYLNESLTIYKNLLIEETDSCANVYILLAGIYANEGDNELSLEYQSEASEIYEKWDRHIATADEVEEYFKSIEEGTYDRELYFLDKEEVDQKLRERTKDYSDIIEEQTE